MPILNTLWISVMALHLEAAHFLTGGNSQRITRLTKDGSSEQIEIFYEFDRELPWSTNKPLDAHVLPAVFYAMERGEPLRVHGVLSRSFMRNIEELQLAWCCWKPERYQRIQVIPDHVVDARRIGNERAISAFSGGVDATFTAIRHANSKDPSRYHLTDVLMVHGFDISLSNPEHFRRLRQRVKPLIDELGLVLNTVRTNSAKALQLNWDDTHAVLIAACLQMFSDHFQFGLIGSTEPYNALIIPWGSTPVTDYLMSGDLMTVVHDGAAFSRTAKIAEIVKHSTACKTLKVCWSGKDQGINCGVCEKCVRTKLNFLAALGVVPECFESGLDIGLIPNLSISNLTQLRELESIADFAEKRGGSYDWLPPLKRRIARGMDKSDRNVIIRAIINILDAFRLKATVKKFMRY
jgi:hypothetical protein